MCWTVTIKQKAQINIYIYIYNWDSLSEQLLQDMELQEKESQD